MEGLHPPPALCPPFWLSCMCPIHTHLPMCLSAVPSPWDSFPTLCVWQTPYLVRLDWSTIRPDSPATLLQQMGASPCLCALSTLCASLSQASYHRSWGILLTLDQKTLQASPFFQVTDSEKWSSHWTGLWWPMGFFPLSCSWMKVLLQNQRGRLSTIRRRWLNTPKLLR